MLPSVTRLRWYLEDSFSEPEHDLASLGEKMGLITELRFIWGHTLCLSASTLCKWISNMRNLQTLQINWKPDTINLILDGAPATLKHLHLVQGDMCSLSELKETLSRFTKLESLTLPGFFDPLNLNDATALVRVPELERRIMEIKKALPDHLQDLKGVFIDSDRGKGSSSPVHLYAEYYRYCTDPKTVAFVLERLLDVGINISIDKNGDTALVNALGFSKPFPGKIKALIEAGADIWRHYSISWPSVESDVGNALHIAALCGEPDATTELLSCVDWEFVRLELYGPLRSSNGFTPVHFVSSSADNWTEIYMAVREIYPAVLSDNCNTRSATPLHAIFLSKLTGSQLLEAIIDTANHIIVIHPDILSENLPQVFSSAFQLFASASLESTYWRFTEKIKSLIRTLLEALKTQLARNNEGCPPTLTRAHLGFSFDESDSEARFLSILGAFLFDQSLVDVLTEGETTEILSTALVLCFYQPDIRSYMFEASDILLSKGADINFVSAEVLNGSSPMRMFMELHTPRFSAGGGGYFSQWRDYWPKLMYFVERKAVCKFEGQLVSLFHWTCTPRVFVYHMRSVDLATKLMNYALETHEADAIAMANGHIEALQMEHSEHAIQSAKAAVGLIQEKNAALLQLVEDQAALQQLLFN